MFRSPQNNLGMSLCLVHFLCTHPCINLSLGNWDYLILFCFSNLSIITNNYFQMNVLQTTLYTLVFVVCRRDNYFYKQLFLDKCHFCYYE